MFFAGIGLAFVIAFVLTLVLGKGIKQYGFADLIGFFFVVFLAAWAGGLWINPVAPGWWGASFVVFVIVGTLVALLVAASLPTPRHRKEHHAAPGGAVGEVHQESFLNVFLAIIILTLIAAIAYRLIESR